MYNNDNTINKYTDNNNIYRTSLSSLINPNEIYNNLSRNSLSGYVNVSVMNLNNRITTLNNLLTADFNLLEAIAFSSVAANFVNIIGSYTYKGNIIRIN